MSVTLLVISVVATATVGVGAGARAQAASVTQRTTAAGPGSSNLTGAADDPVGVSIETLSADPTGAIRVDGVPAARTTIPGNLNYAVISRADRSVVTSGTTSKDSAGVRQLMATATLYSVRNEYLMVVSGTTGIDGPAAGDFSALVQQIGVADDGLTQAMKDALTTQSASFSVLGIPGGAHGNAWLNVGLVQADLPPSPPYVLPAKGDISGHLQWNTLADQYDYTDEQFPEFSSDLVKDHVASNTMSFNGGDYPADVAAGTSGFHVLVVDSVTLRVLANQTLPTNGGTTPVATLQDDFARQLAADAHMAGFQQFYASKQPPLVLMQSYGHPTGAVHAWQTAAETVSELGGNHLAFLNLGDQGDFSLIGSIGSASVAAEASNVTGQPGPIAGVLARTHAMAFAPSAAGPGQVNGQLLRLAYQDPQPFPAFDGGQADAAAWIGAALHLCPHVKGCDIREAFRTDYGAVSWSVLAAKLALLKYPQGTDFSRQDFSAAGETLQHEFLDIQNVQIYFEKLASVFHAAEGRSVINVKSIGDQVYASVQPPSNEKTVFIITLIGKIVALGGFFAPPASTLSAGLSAAFALGAYLVSKSGASTLPDRVQARASQLSDLLADDLNNAAASFAMIGRLIATDGGKLTRFQNLYLTDGWKLEPSSEPAINAMTLAARQWFATELVTFGYSHLGVAFNASPNDLLCGFYQHAEYVKIHPWTNEPALAQFRAVVGYDGNHPVTQTVFFSRDPDFDVGDNGPPDGIAQLLFAAQGSQPPLLNQYAFMSVANFGKVYPVANNGDCN